MGRDLSHQVVVQLQQCRQPLGASGPSQDPQSLHFTEHSGNVLRLSFHGDKRDLEKSFLLRACSFLSGEASWKGWIPKAKDIETIRVFMEAS